MFEVVVSLAILSIGLSTVFYLIGDSLRGSRRAFGRAEAASLAQSLLDQVGRERVLQVGAFKGQFANGYGWRLTVEPFGDTTERQLWPVGAYKVATEVTWQEGPGPQTYKLTTLRLGAKEAAP